MSALTVLQPHQPQVMPSGYTVIALEPVWVPHEPVDHEPGALVRKRGRENKAEGPNGEPADSGKWRLRLPDGSIYRGPTISASALDTASECQHKWALDRIDGLEKPPNRKAELGGHRHSELELWLKTAVSPTTEGMVKVLPHFPMPGQCESEVYFGLLFGRPGKEIVFAGWIDARESILDDRSYTVRVDEEGNEVVDVPVNSTIRDLKTTGDFRWKKTPAQLRANIQACLYGLGEMSRIDAAHERAGRKTKCDAVILKWTYAQLKEINTAAEPDKCKIMRVETVCACGECGGASNDAEHVRRGGVLLTREEAAATVAQYLPLAEKMLEAIAAAELGEITAKDLEKNGDSCSMYGGCPWKKSGACDLPAGGGFFSKMRQQRARLGFDVPKKLEVGGAVEIAVTQTNTQTTQGKKMGLGERFAKKTASGVAAKAAAAAEVQDVPVATAAKPAATAPASAAKGLGSRFAAKMAPAAEPATPKLEVKAVSDGMASRNTAAAAAAAASGATAPGAGLTLMERMKQLAGGGAGGAGGAVERAVAAAPKHAVSALSVGINPPDAAPEWTAEQQAAESARLAGEKPAKVLKAAEAPAEASVDAGEPVKRGRGRPKGSTAAVVASRAPVPALPDVATLPGNGASVAGAMQAVDAIVMHLMQGGYRREAAALLRANGEIAEMRPISGSGGAE